MDTSRIREAHEARCAKLKRRKKRATAVAYAESYEQRMKNSTTRFIDALTESAPKWLEEKKLPAYEFHVPVAEFEPDDKITGHSFSEMLPYLFRGEDYTYFGKHLVFTPRAIIHEHVNEYRLVLLHVHTRKFVLAYEHRDVPSYCCRRWEPPCVVQ